MIARVRGMLTPDASDHNDLGADSKVVDHLYSEHCVWGGYGHILSLPSLLERGDSICAVYDLLHHLLHHLVSMVFN